MQHLCAGDLWQPRVETSQAFLHVSPVRDTDCSKSVHQCRAACLASSAGTLSGRQVPAVRFTVFGPYEIDSAVFCSNHCQVTYCLPVLKNFMNTKRQKRSWLRAQKQLRVLMFYTDHTAHFTERNTKYLVSWCDWVRTWQFCNMIWIHRHH